MIKHMFLHYNPAHKSTISPYLNVITKNAYSQNSYGTLYIKNIEPTFYIMARYAAETRTYVYLECGFTKLAFEDKFKYNKKTGKQLSQINCRLRPVEINSIYTQNKKTYIKCLIEGFQFIVEFNHTTDRYFIETFYY